MENPENKTVNEQELAFPEFGENTITSNFPEQFTSQKGSCLECDHYNRCPRMRGINFCFSAHTYGDEQFPMSKTTLIDQNM